MMAGENKKGKSSTSTPSSTPSKTSAAAATRSKTEQNPTELENLDLKATLKAISEKLDTFLSENIKLREDSQRHREENATLSQRIDTLEALLRDKENTPPPPPPPKPNTVPSGRENFEILILSDSMLRHVMGDCPKKKEDAKLKTAIMDLQLPFANRQVCQKAIEQDISLKVDSSPNPKIHRPPLRVKEVVIPGARAHRLLSEATVLSRAYNFEHVIVHVGTNYVPFVPEQAITDITKLLDALPHLFPGCRVTFSPILP